MDSRRDFVSLRPEPTPRQRFSIEGVAKSTDSKKKKTKTPQPKAAKVKAAKTKKPVPARNPARINISSNTPWEKVVGYSRVVRVGNIVEVTGTVATDESGKPIGNTPYAQTLAALRKIKTYLHLAGATIEDVIRTRIYVTDISKWKEVGRAHGEVFRDIRPATSMIQISALIDPAFLVEIEASAVLPEKQKLQTPKADKPIQAKKAEAKGSSGKAKAKGRGRSQSPKRATAKQLAGKPNKSK